MCASSDCPSASEGSEEGPYVVAGLCGRPGTTGHVVGTCGGSLHHYRGQGVHTEASRGVQRMLLRENACGHVTCSDFARGTLCTSGVGVGAEQGALGRVGGAWGVVPRVVLGVAGPGASVSRSRGWWWVPGCRGWWWWAGGVCSWSVLTL